MILRSVAQSLVNMLELPPFTFFLTKYIQGGRSGSCIGFCSGNG